MRTTILKFVFFLTYCTLIEGQSTVYRLEDVGCSFQDSLCSWYPKGGTENFRWALSAEEETDIPPQRNDDGHLFLFSDDSDEGVGILWSPRFYTDAKFIIITLSVFCSQDVDQFIRLFRCDEDVCPEVTEFIDFQCYNRNKWNYAQNITLESGVNNATKYFGITLSGSELPLAISDVSLSIDSDLPHSSTTDNHETVSSESNWSKTYTTPNEDQNTNSATRDFTFPSTETNNYTSSTFSPDVTSTTESLTDNQTTVSLSTINPEPNTSLRTESYTNSTDITSTREDDGPKSTVISEINGNFTSTSMLSSQTTKDYTTDSVFTTLTDEDNKLNTTMSPNENYTTALISTAITDKEYTSNLTVTVTNDDDYTSSSTYPLTNGDDYTPSSTFTVSEDDIIPNSTFSLVTDEHTPNSTFSLVTDEHTPNSTFGLVTDEHTPNSTSGLVTDEHTPNSTFSLVTDEHTPNSTITLTTNENYTHSTFTVTTEDFRPNLTSSSTTEDHILNSTLTVTTHDDTTPNSTLSVITDKDYTPNSTFILTTDDGSASDSTFTGTTDEIFTSNSTFTVTTEKDYIPVYGISEIGCTFHDTFCSWFPKGGTKIRWALSSVEKSDIPSFKNGTGYLFLHSNESEEGMDILWSQRFYVNAYVITLTLNVFCTEHIDHFIRLHRCDEDMCPEVVEFIDFNCYNKDAWNYAQTIALESGVNSLTKYFWITISGFKPPLAISDVSLSVDADFTTSGTVITDIHTTPSSVSDWVNNNTTYSRDFSISRATENPNVSFTESKTDYSSSTTSQDIKSTLNTESSTSNWTIVPQSITTPEEIISLGTENNTGSTITTSTDEDEEHTTINTKTSKHITTSSSSTSHTDKNYSSNATFTVTTEGYSSSIFTMTTDGMQNSTTTTDGIPSSSMITDGMTNSSMVTNGTPNSTITTGGKTNSTMTTNGMQNSTITTDGMPNSTMVTDGMSSSIMTTNGMTNSIMTTGGKTNSTMTTGGMPNSTITTDRLQNSTITTDRIPNSTITTDGMTNFNMTTDGISNSTFTLITNEDYTSDLTPTGETHEDHTSNSTITVTTEKDYIFGISEIGCSFHDSYCSWFSRGGSAMRWTLSVEEESGIPSPQNGKGYLFLYLNENDKGLDSLWSQQFYVKADRITLTLNVFCTEDVDQFILLHRYDEDTLPEVAEFIDFNCNNTNAWNYAQTVTLESGVNNLTKYFWLTITGSEPPLAISDVSLSIDADFTSMTISDIHTTPSSATDWTNNNTTNNIKLSTFNITLSPNENSSTASTLTMTTGEDHTPNSTFTITDESSTSNPTLTITTDEGPTSNSTFTTIDESFSPKSTVTVTTDQVFTPKSTFTLITTETSSFNLTSPLATVEDYTPTSTFTVTTEKDDVPGNYYDAFI